MSATLVIPLPTRRTTRLLARRVAALVRPGDVVYLEGPLGAGKTFFTRALCRGLGVDASVPVQSPTFALLHTLDGRTSRGAIGIVHADFYRLHSSDEVHELGLRDLIADNVVVIEWGLRFEDAIGEGLVVTLSLRNGVREATLSARGGRGEALLAGLMSSGVVYATDGAERES